MTIDEVGNDVGYGEILKGNFFQYFRVKLIFDEFVRKEGVTKPIFQMRKEFGGVVHFQTENMILREEGTNEFAHVGKVKVTH